MPRRQLRAGAGQARGIFADAGDLAEARPTRGFAGIAPRGGGGDGRVAREAGRQLLQPAGCRPRIAGQDGHVGIAAGAQRLVEVRGLADRRCASRMRGLQRSVLQPALDDGGAARSGLGVVGQPHPGAGGGAGVQRGQAGVERVLVDADRHQDDGKRGRGRAHFALGL